MDDENDLTLCGGDKKLESARLHYSFSLSLPWPGIYADKCVGVRLEPLVKFSQY